jgi:phospholipid transport system substrate-binding protein
MGMSDLRMATRRSVAILIALSALLPVRLQAAPEPGDPAVAQVEMFYAALIDNMKRGKELGIQGRYQQLAPVAEETFDLAGMARLTVGPAWSTMPETDHKAIVDAFGRLTLSNYAKNFNSFGGERFVVDPMVKMRNEDKIIESKLLTGRSTVPFNYRMHLVGDKWKVLDVYLNGYVSQVALRRADFSSTVASSGASGLVKKIDELVDRQMKGAS